MHKANWAIIIAACSGDGTPDIFLPDADCEYLALPHEGGHWRKNLVGSVVSGREEICDGRVYSQNC